MTRVTPEVPATPTVSATAKVPAPAPANSSGGVWFVYLSTSRPDPATLAKVERVDAGRTSILTAVLGPDGSNIRLLEQADLPPGGLRKPGVPNVTALAAALIDLLARASGPVVLAAADRIAQLASWTALQDEDQVAQVDLDQVVVASALDPAIRVVAMLAAGADVAEVLHPQGFSVALSVADAGIGPVASATSPAETSTAETSTTERSTSETLITKRFVTVDENPTPSDAPSGTPPDTSRGTSPDTPPDTPWLTIGDQTIEVRTQGMSRWSARAVTVRAGTARRVAEPEPRRLVMGPANYAGQGGEWARAVREHAPGWTARNMHVVAPSAVLVFGADLPLTTVEWAEPGTRLDLAVELVVGATDVVVEAMRPLLAVRDPGDAANITDEHRAREDVEALRASGRNVAFLFHGSEVRRPRENARLTPWSPFYRAESWALTIAHERKTERVHAALAGFDGPVLVSTPDLLDHVPGAVWLPIVVGEVSFLPTEPALTRPRPVVAHAPSSSWLKGSQWVDPVLERMEAEGLLTYRRLEDLSPIMVPALLREVDVVVDQVVLGNPGVLAAQAMAAGRLVLAHLPEPVRRRFGDPPPVVETTPATVEQVLLSVIENPEHYATIAARGVGFARKFHDGRMSAQILTEAMG